MSDPQVEAVMTFAARAACGFQSVRGPRPSILIFHRVPTVADPLFPEEVDAARFERLMTLVSRVFNVLPCPTR